MAITVRSASAAVRRTLTDLAALAAPESQAALVLEDGLHPPAGAAKEEAPILRLVAIADAEDDVTCPVAPAALAELIVNRLRETLPRIALNTGWEFDPTARQLRHATQPAVALTEKEALLLAALAKSYPNACKREALLKNVWAYGEQAETHTLETHIYRLRGKLEALTPRPCDIVAAEGSYRLVVE